MFDWLFGKKSGPIKKTVFIPNLVIEAFSADRPDGTAQVNPAGAAVIRISATKKGGKIWLDKDVAAHELQHLCAVMDPEFGQPDNNIVG